MINKTIRQVLLPLAAVTSFSANAAPQYSVFNIDESVIPGAASNTVVANWLDFSYNSVILQTLPNGAFTQTGAFSVSAYKFVDTVTGVSTAPSQLNLPEPLAGGIGYQLGGTFTAAGSAVPSTDPAGFVATFNSFALTLQYDADQDGVYDGILATATLSAFSTAFLDLDPNTSGFGDFNITLAFTPEGSGLNYFDQPDPFYTKLVFTGNNKTVVPGAIENGVQRFAIDGSGNLVFDTLAVPEPSALALFGLGLIGLGAIRRAVK